MTSEALFGLALGLSSPWKVVSSDIVDGRLEIRIDFEKGARFENQPVHDTVERSWQHLNFWQYPTMITARVPRVKGPDGKVNQVEVPWASPGSGFTILFEAMALTMMKSMTVSQVAKLLFCDDMKLWRLAERSLAQALKSLDLSKVRRVGVDETKSLKGHEYITVFADLDTRKVIFACIGKGAASLERFASELLRCGADPAQIECFCSDMSRAFLSGIKRFFPSSEIVIDKFHLVKLVSEAVDATRKAEMKHAREKVSSRFLWLKNPGNLSDDERRELSLLNARPAFEKTGRAYTLKLAFQELFHVKKRVSESRLDEWLDEALSCGIAALERVAETIFRHRKMILSWFDKRISNGLLEGLHSVLQSAKNRARGYANPDHLILMSYLIHGQLNMIRTTK